MRVEFAALIAGDWRKLNADHGAASGPYRPLENKSDASNGHLSKLARESVPFVVERRRGTFASHVRQLLMFLFFRFCANFCAPVNYDLAAKSTMPRDVGNERELVARGRRSFTVFSRCVR